MTQLYNAAVMSVFAELGEFIAIDEDKEEFIKIGASKALVYGWDEATEFFNEENFMKLRNKEGNYQKNLDIMILKLHKINVEYNDDPKQYSSKMIYYDGKVRNNINYVPTFHQFARFHYLLNFDDLIQ